MIESNHIKPYLESYWPLLIGPIGGFVSFMIGLCTMEGIFFRPNEKGELKWNNYWMPRICAPG